MDRKVKTSDNFKGKSSYKIGEDVVGVRATICGKNGKEELGRVVYKRKPEYGYDPYEKRT
ncbi:hypothetical protein [Heyndrickxia acidicola]|uniref:Uncharacterized protein n=1 Tax=Heyndrickxia acidicola TaxID=209389 RepID=A0ABU6MN31_9BACI|nr:hypothetical protein [Heyndrickxia acidicola]MED1206110.1 hypothetical protein [Heyndrickxia acidicola]